MRVDFSKLEIVQFLRNVLEKQHGEVSASQALHTLQVAAALLCKCTTQNERDQDFRRATNGLKDVDGIKSFADAVDALYPALLDEPLLTPRDLIKKTAESSGHIVRQRAQTESLVEENSDEIIPTLPLLEISAWDLRKDDDYRHGEHLPVSYTMLVALRDRIAKVCEMQVHSAGRLLARICKAAAAKNGLDVTSKRAQVTLEKVPYALDGLVDAAVRRMKIESQVRAWESLDEELITILAVTLPLADSLDEISDLLSMRRDDQILAVQALGNACKCWCERVENGRDASVPTIARSICKNQAEKALRNVRLAMRVDTTSMQQDMLF